MADYSKSSKAGMEGESNKNCSHSEQNGLDSRACSNKVFKLFGLTMFKLFGEIILISQGDHQEMKRKSANVGNLDSRNGLEKRASKQRKKGVPWTEEEHGRFLLGLARCGKGNWKKISEDFVKSRTPTQVASHAQKYFKHKNAPQNKKHKPNSIFDMEMDNNASTSKVAPASSPLSANNIPESINLHNHDNHLSGFVAKNKEAIGTSGIPPTFSPVPE